MNTRLPLLPVLFLVLVLAACQSISQSPTPSPFIPAARIESTVTPSTFPSLTFTPLPSPVSTSTFLPPSLTPTIFTTPTPTLIPVDTQLSIFENIWTIVNNTYVYPDFNGLDWNAVHQEYTQKIRAGLSNQDFYTAMAEMISRLGDEHSYFINPQQVAEQNAEYEGKHDYVGIGVLAGAVPERKRAVILSVIPGSPAESAGLQARDSIISVDGTPILDDQGFLRDIVRGPEGTSLTINVQSPGGDPRDISLIRNRIISDFPVVYQLITTPEGKKIGYIFLVTFLDTTVAGQVSAAIKEMSSDGPLDGIILDNRMNNGGTITVAETVLSYFMGGNLGYFIRHDEQRLFELLVDDIEGSSHLPLAVLIGPGTASFGEIFSGILQDFGRATVIGTPTDGNVEILWGYDLEDGSQLWLANETFQPFNHPDQNWEATGVIPDFSVSGDFDQYNLANDPPVLAAIQQLANK